MSRKQITLVICSSHPFESYEPGDTVRTFNISDKNILNIEEAKAIFSRRLGYPASMPIRGNRTPFRLKECTELYEVEKRPSYFQQNEHKIKIF